MINRKTYILSALLALIMLLCAGCGGRVEQTAELESGEPLATQTDADAAAASQDNGIDLIGFIIDDDGSVQAYMSMYGFLRTAQTLGYPAKLYRAKTGQPAADAVQQAVQDGCKGILVSDPDGANDTAVQLAVSSGLKVVVPYHECSVSGIDSNVVADTGEYVEELCRGLSARLTERSLKSGRILVYGWNTAQSYPQFAAILAEYYPQYTAVAFDRTAVDDEAAIDELAQFILYNRDIKGMYVVDSDLALISVRARKRAQITFNNDGAPSPTPTPDNLATDTTVTPNQNLLKTISITIFASGLSDENYELFNDSDIYALCIEPYYEACTQATMYLDKLLNGDEIAAVTRINRPIAYADTIEKYAAIFTQAKKMFGLLDETE